MRIATLAMILPLLFSCATQQEIDYDNPITEEEFESKELKQRLAQVKVNELSNSKVTEFIFNRAGQLSYVCTRNPCGSFRQPKGYSIYLNRNGSFSSFIKPTDPNQLLICGTGNAGEYFDQHNLWQHLGIRRNRQFYQNTNWSNQNPEFCHHQFTRPKTYTDIGLWTVRLVSKKLASQGVHVREYYEPSLQKKVVRTDLDQISSLLLNQPNLLNRNYAVVNFSSNNFTASLQAHLDSSSFDSKAHSGIVFHGKTEDKNHPLWLVLPFSNKHRPGDVSSLLDQLQAAIDKNAHVSHEDTAFISRYIPPKIKIPEIPPIPILNKGEFEKRSEFEQRAKQFVAQREEKIHLLEQQYNLDRFRRNEYIKAITGAYHNYLNNRNNNNRAVKRLFQDNALLVSRLIFQSLYSDAVISQMDFDAERSILYFTVHSRRNQLKERAALQIDATKAKRIKIDQAYNMRLSVLANGDKIEIKGIDVLSDSETHFAKFTDSNFKPMVMRMRPNVEPAPTFSPDLAQYKHYLQEDNDFEDNTPKTKVYVELQQSYNLTRPEWYLNVAEDRVVASGQSLKLALENGLAILALVKEASVDTKTIMSESSTQIDELLQSFRADYNSHSVVKSNLKLKNSDYRITRQAEIDGEYYVELALR